MKDNNKVRHVVGEVTSVMSFFQDLNQIERLHYQLISFARDTYHQSMMFMSFLKQKKLKYRPFKLQMAARNSALHMQWCIYQTFKIGVTKIAQGGESAGINEIPLAKRWFYNSF